MHKLLYSKKKVLVCIAVSSHPHTYICRYRPLPVSAGCPVSLLIKKVSKLGNCLRWVCVLNKVAALILYIKYLINQNKKMLAFWFHILKKHESYLKLFLCFFFILTTFYAVYIYIYNHIDILSITTLYKTFFIILLRIARR